MAVYGKTVMITGASRGIGEATAEAFGEAGANVVLLARGETEIGKIAARIGRAASSSSISFATAATEAAVTKRPMPAYNVGKRPNRSDASPDGICPSDIPNMKTPTICCPRDSVVLSASTMAGIAGKLRSTVNAATAVSRPSVMIKLRDLARCVFKCR